MPTSPPPVRLALALPKGRMQDGLVRLLEAAGISVRATARAYRPLVALPDCDTKLLKPQSIVEMLDAGVRDVGFVGDDWVQERGAELVEVLDTGLDPVRIVAAAPTAILLRGALPRRRLRVATEYVCLTQAWIEREGLDASIVRSFGATEVYPPEDADLIVDNTATGSTLVANGLEIVAEVRRSSTRLVASQAAWKDDAKRARITDLATALQAVLAARSRVLVEANVSEAQLAEVIAALPGMRAPTVSTLAEGAGFAVKAAVPREGLSELLPRLKRSGASDLVVLQPGQILP